MVNVVIFGIRRERYLLTALLKIRESYEPDGQVHSFP